MAAEGRTLPSCGPSEFSSGLASDAGNGDGGSSGNRKKRIRENRRRRLDVKRAKLTELEEELRTLEWQVRQEPQATGPSKSEGTSLGSRSGDASASARSPPSSSSLLRISPRMSPRAKNVQLAKDHATADQRSSPRELHPRKAGGRFAAKVSLPEMLNSSSHRQTTASALTTFGGGNSNHEAQVLMRVAQLQKEGLWIDRKLSTKWAAPARAKTHWDYVMEEMAWLSSVFQQEVKLKKVSSRKCAKMVVKHFSDQVLQAKKAEKAQEQNLRRIAGTIAKEVRTFWGNVEKLFEFSLRTEIEKKRKQALDEHLNFIVDKTEKYSSLLAESMAEAPTTTNTSLRTTPESSEMGDDRLRDDGGGEEEDEYVPNQASDDDEETIAKDDHHEEGEVDKLKAESEVPVEELLRRYYPELYPADAGPVSALSSENGTAESRTTSSRSSRAERVSRRSRKVEEPPGVKESVSPRKSDSQDLKEDTAEVEAEEPLQTLDDSITKDNASRDKSRLLPTETGSFKTKSSDDDDDGKDPEDEDNEEGDTDVDDDEDVDEGDDEEDDDDQEDATKLLLEKENDGSKEKFSDVIEMAAKFQPTGNTLDTTNVKTKVPFLLKHSLREYQHIGLDWLVSMYERKLNGILADEMGLGKTIQTIAFLAHLACDRHNWGPHLIVVPTSVMLNWDMEFKKWAPAFKVLTYYGSQKERRMKRVGWTKPNSFHVCITSYKLVIQDHQSFRRKRWTYVVLDEAQHIKNFRSQRWQLLLNFQSSGRLLLTGTPLQNDLMELWSLMHFLMPNVFESHRDFKEWFSNPLTGMVEGSAEYNDGLVRRLHKVLRPFLLRRLKAEVEKQMPRKFEHLLRCPLSKRQRFLYDDFMSRANTRQTLESGNLLSVINVLMQLRKVCNHPNLFEPRPTLSPFIAQDHHFHFSEAKDGLCLLEKLLQTEKHPLHPQCGPGSCMAPHSPLGALLGHELLGANSSAFSAFAAHRASNLRAKPAKMFESFLISTWKAPAGCEEIFGHDDPGFKGLGKGIIQSDENPYSPIRSPPSNKVRLTIKHQINPGRLTNKIPLATIVRNRLWRQMSRRKEVMIRSPQGNFVLTSGPMHSTIKRLQVNDFVAVPAQQCRIVQEGHLDANEPGEQGINKDFLVSKKYKDVHSIFHGLVRLPGETRKVREYFGKIQKPRKSDSSVGHEFRSSAGCMNIEDKLKRERDSWASRVSEVNELRCSACPMYGKDLIDSITFFSQPTWQLLPVIGGKFSSRNEKSRGVESEFEGEEGPDVVEATGDGFTLYDMQRLVEPQEVVEDRLASFVRRFILYVPPCVAFGRSDANGPPPMSTELELASASCLQVPEVVDRVEASLMLQLPETRLIEYDCGKLQVMSRLLRNLKEGNHRVLVFTQMTKVLDVLESFLSHHGFIYLRLDGSTKVEQRQILMERFNNNTKYFCFILSTRSGGVGINLTGADTVVFYDSDWNPTMDAQAQDRCHRIGQTRDVHIYRLVSERTIEENILKKANQKRLLGDLAIEGGNFTTAFFKKQTIHDLFNVDDNPPQEAQEAVGIGQKSSATPAGEDDDRDPTEASKQGAFESALSAVEDVSDIKAMKQAKAEEQADIEEFDEDAEKVDSTVSNLKKQLTPVERYALAFIESNENEYRLEQLRAADAQIEAQKQDFDVEKIESLTAEVGADNSSKGSKGRLQSGT